MKHLDANIINTYRQLVEKTHPTEIDIWPILNGYNLRFEAFRGWNIFIFENTENSIALKIPLERLTTAIVGIDDIGSDIELARKKLTRYYRLSNSDMLVILNMRASNLEQELDIALKQHDALLKKKAAADPKREIKETKAIPETEIPVKADKPAVEQVVIPQLQQKENMQALEKQEQKNTPEQQENVIPEKQPYENKIFLINGANDKMKKSMRNFLLSLGLQAVEWAEALNLIGKPDPDYEDVIRYIFEHCQVAVIILANDKQENSFPGEESELRFISQAELNAIFIAGLAAGINRHRTVVVGLGNPRPFCDIPGLHLSSLDNSQEKRREFMELLKIAGCDVKPKGRAWQISGDFDIEIKPIHTEIMMPTQSVDNDHDPKIQGSLIQPDTSPKYASGSAEHPTIGRFFIESLPILNIFKAKIQPMKNETIQSDLIVTEPAESKLMQKEHDQLSVSSPEQEPLPEDEKAPSAPPETRFEFEGSQEPLTEAAPEETASETSSDELEYLERIKALEEKLEALKTRPGRINQRAIDDLEKQIQSDNYRLRTIRQLANIENLKKDYLTHEPYGNKGIRNDE